MVRDGYFYALGLGVVAAILWVLTHSLWLVAIPLLLAAFFLWFFRDPQRTIPAGPGQIVSPGDGVVTEAEWIETVGGSRLRLSIFLNVFDVHMNRCPVAGTIKIVEFREGGFLNAMKPESVLTNEQTLVVIDAGGYDVGFKQIAGLLARRIVCNLKVGDRVERGQRMGLIKFGSRVDVLMPAEANLKVKMGSRVRGGSTVLAEIPLGALPGNDRGGLMAAEETRLDGYGEAGTGAGTGKLKRQPSRGMYVLPSVFTAGNIAAGYYAIVQAIQGVVAQDPSQIADHFDHAALAIGFAVLFDGVDGRVARMTSTTSDFGKELDSLADVITFGVAPSLLAYIWGFRMLPMMPLHAALRGQLVHAGVFVCFLFLICGASRLARFNISINPQPRNPGKPGHKYFVGMPIPAGAGVIASIIHFRDGWPIDDPWFALGWLCLIVLTGFLMVSSWRFWSGKEIGVESKQPFQMVALIAVLGILVALYSEWMLIFIAIGYLISGVLARLAYGWSRDRRSPRT